VDHERFKTGLHRVSDHVYAFMQPDGSWGLNNMGVVVGQGRSLLIDAATDIPRTRAVVDALARAVPGSEQIETVLITHWHLDHVWGAALFPDDQRIVTSKRVAKYLREHPTLQLLEYLLKLEGDAKKMMDYFLGDKFDFSGLRAVYASEEFEGKIDLEVDGLRVEVTETQPSHTLSDSVALIPQEGVVHLGDLLSGDRHWLLQYPSSANLIATCELLISFHADVYIPGHGPLLDVYDIKRFLEYVHYIREHVRSCYDKGMTAEEAGEFLLTHLGPYEKMEGPARLFSTSKMLYTEFAGSAGTFREANPQKRFAESWRLMHTIPVRYPHLAQVQPHVVDVLRQMHPAAE
jgi:glyoxylase-like metal-dependent hydrolase (beta-lactamase superfamily II)